MRFVVNNKPVELVAADADMTLLRYLRMSAQMMGTKEGCASGDCGACTVIIGRPGAQGMVFSTVNACIFPLGSLQDCHVITVEALAQTADSLHPVQAAMVTCHASQCGFCTPGFVMSLACLQLTASAELAEADESVQRAAVIAAISGNLCRCTGYRPIIAAGITALKKADHVNSFVQEWVPNAPLASKISELPDCSAASISTADSFLSPVLQAEGSHYWQPHTEAGLQHLLDSYPQARLIAGGTDLMLEVTQQYKSLMQMIDLNRVTSLQQVEINEREIIIGAAVCYSQLEKSLCELSPEFVALLGRLGARQIRNRGTLGGNICNASPIADMPPYLLVLDAEVEIINGRGEVRREKLTHFYRGYKKTSLMTGEYLARIYIAREQLVAPLKLFKISKRYEDDISAVMGAFYWREPGDNKAGEFKIAFGGMAAIPKRATHTEMFLSQQAWCVAGVADKNIIEHACTLLRSEFSPLSDVRASAEYRMAMACNLLKKSCYEFAAASAGHRIEARLFAHA